MEGFEIKVIKCPRLNQIYRNIGPVNTSITLEVVVGFEAGIPREILCDEYDSNKKICNLSQEKCTYQDWKSLS